MEDRESGEPCCGFCDVVFRCPPVVSPPSFSGSWYVQLMALQSGHVSHGIKSPHLQSHSLSTMSSNKSSGYLVHMGGNHGVPLLPNMSIVSQGLCLKYFPGLYSCVTQTPSLFRHSKKKPFPCLFQLSEVIFIHWLYPSFIFQNSNGGPNVLLVWFLALLPPSCIYNDLCDPNGSPM